VTIINYEKIDGGYTVGSNLAVLKFVDLEKAIPGIRILFQPVELTVSKMSITC